ncbi:MAG: hypothetical protein ABMA64_32360 [Myxococcota bacterium]
MWERPPSADELLADRLAFGWKPTPSSLAAGPRVLGHAERVPMERWRGSGEGVCKPPD